MRLHMARLLRNSPRDFDSFFGFFKLIVFVFLIQFLGACSTNPVTGDRDFVLMSEKDELELGRKYHSEVLKEYKIYNNPQLQAYVEEIGERLASKSHRNNLVWHFYLLDSPQVNAFATPGGYIYITRGIMAYMQEEAHLAGVIGHEIGHVTARHSVRQQAQSSVVGLLGAAVAIGTGNKQAAQVSNLLGGAVIKGYGRSHELESDRLGAEYLAKSGYDPQEMLDVVGILKNQELADKARAKAEGREPRAYHGVFASHPQNDTRLQEVIRAADKFKSSAITRRDDGRFMRLTNGMTYGSSESQGVIRGNKFLHKELDFHIGFPQGWIIDNLPDRIVARNPRADQQIQVSLRDLNKRQSARDFLASNFKPFGEGRSVNTSEEQAYAGKAIVATNKSGSKEKVQVAAVYRGKKAFMVYSRGAQLPEREFFQTVESLRRLRGGESSQAKAKKIYVRNAQYGDTFARLAAQSPNAGAYAEQELRLINGMFPTGEPTAGQPIKLLR